jgi:hypothetical protein
MALERDWWAQQQRHLGHTQALENQAVESQLHAGRSFGNLGGFAQAEAQRNAIRDQMRAAQAAQNHNAWAGGRQIQHQRDLENQQLATQQYKAETDRIDSNNRAGVGMAAMNGLGNMGYGNFNFGSPQVDTDLFDNQGNRIGGGTIRSSLLRK